MKHLACLIIITALSAVPRAYSQDLTAEQIFEKYKDAVVVITSFDVNGKKDKQGSGVILNDQSVIITNFHLYSGTEKLEIKNGDKDISYEGIWGVNIERDLMIIKISAGTNYPNITLADNEKLKVGQKIYAIGSPMGLENSLTDGLISGFRTLNPEDDKTEKDDYIQISASISHGSSGGAVLNSAGELIGISTMSYKEGQNLNFAIPVSNILKVLSGDFMDHKKLESLSYFYKGYKAVEDGNYEEAVKFYTQYIEASQGEAKAYNYRGLAYSKLKNYKKAVADFTRAIEIDGKFIKAYNNRGESYFRLEEYDKAIKDFSKALQIDPDNTTTLYARGLTYSKNEDYSKAIKDFSKVIELDPDFVYSYINRGFAYYATEEYEYAVKDWEKAIRLDPSYEKDLRPYINYASLKDYVR
jgi:tetratricopeptide (TPR) repeat protein